MNDSLASTEGSCDSNAAPSESSLPAWLDHYGSTAFDWCENETSIKSATHLSQRRAVGNVEFSFDSDGRYWEGRADLSTEILLNIQTSLDAADIRERIILAWAALRCSHHWLLQARTQYFNDQRRPDLVIDRPKTVEQAVADARQNIVFLDDLFPNLDSQEFWTHALNTARVLNPHTELTRLFVYDPIECGKGRYQLRLFMISAHMVADGLSNMIVKRDFTRLLNDSSKDLHQLLATKIRAYGTLKDLPVPQEMLYSPIKGSIARQRWYWVLVRILRHVRRPLPAAFPNPLRRPEDILKPDLPARYAPLLNYSRSPVNHTTPLFARASLAATQRLHALARSVNASVGAGCFALIALIHMEMYEQQFPDIPLEERRPFIAGFPLNPRPFLYHSTEPNSVMLAFCDGIVFPFLSSSLPFGGRMKLLIRQAHRQLSSYQKRRFTQPLSDAPTSVASDLQAFGSRGAERVIPNQYLMSIERAEAQLPDALRKNKDDASVNPQGAYPARMNATFSTCNISSIGKVDPLLQPGVYDLEDDSKDLVADLIETRYCVRAREGEFLVGVGGDMNGLWVNVSVDSSSMDPVLVQQWKDKFETLLEGD